MATKKTLVTTTNKTNKKDNTTLYMAIGGLLLVGGVAMATSKSNPTKIGSETFANPTPNPTPGQSAAGASSGSTTVTLNKDLILKNGSKGNEVKELQKLLGITADGSFGPQTETSLFAKKGVKQISLNGFTKAANVVANNPNPYNVGTKLMANKKPTINVFDAIQKADLTYYTTNKIETTVNYGEEVGTIVGMTGSKNSYLIKRKNFFGVEYKYFVNASDVIKF